jgi:hypothetical protein
MMTLDSGNMWREKLSPLRSALVYGMMRNLHHPRLSMPMNQPVTRLLTLLALLSSMACSSNPEPQRRYSSGLNGSSQVSTLTDEQLEQICKTYDVYVNTEVDLSSVAYVACLPLAVFTTRTKADCQASLNNCMAIFPTPIKVSAKADNAQVCATTLKQCQAKVSDLESCVTVNVDQALSVAEVWTCDRVTDPEYRDMTSANGLVNVCKNVDNACNQFAAVETPEVK